MQKTRQLAISQKQATLSLIQQHPIFRILTALYIQMISRQMIHKSRLGFYQERDQCSIELLSLRFHSWKGDSER